MLQLPIHAVLDSLKSALSQHDSVVLEAPPGAGKTTIVPLELLHEPWLSGQKILMLEPRRIAARAAAERMAEQLGEAVGETVGYRVRLDSKITAKTRIEVVTEGVLLRMLQSDPSLEGYGIILFDEFHERSLDSDLSLALTLESRALFREDTCLKLLVMSATLDGAAVSALLDDAPIISSEGKQHPVEIIYSDSRDSNTPLEQRVSALIIDASEIHKESILCFLPGVREIRQVQEVLETQLGQQPDPHILPLYGDLTLAQQKQVIQPASVGERKVVLATNIAETSLTIDGVAVVIDAGLSRETRFDPNTGMDRLLTRKVTQAEAHQRAGRAGRLGPGYCYRLWSEGQQTQLPRYPEPEVTRADLCSLLLQIKSWGADSVAELSWLDQPASGPLQQSHELLTLLGALDNSGNLTTHGRQMAELAAHPRISHMLIKGATIGLSDQACKIAALLSERDPLKQRNADINKRLSWLNEKPRFNASAWHRLKQQTKQFQTALKKLQIEIVTDNPGIEEPYQAGLLLSFAYPDRIGSQRQKNSDRYKLSNGRTAVLFEADALHKHLWLVSAQLSSKQNFANDMITLAAPVTATVLQQYHPELIQEAAVFEWGDNDKLVAETQQRIGGLVLSSRTEQKISPEQRQAALLTLVRQKGLNYLNWDEDSCNLRQRIQFLAQHDKQNEWPDLSDQWLLNHLDSWLTPYLNGINNGQQLQKLNILPAIQALLPWSLQQTLDQLAPIRFKVPSGSNIRIDYSQQPPVLAVKLQEMFGSTQTPTVAHHVALQLHLLSPAGRPLQVTQDLIAFWDNAYKEVQKEMKGRYPKHPWPDDPLTAIATAKTKRHLQNTKKGA